MIYTPVMWPFLASLLVTVALARYAWQRRHIPAAETFAWLMLALSYWTFCYLMELISPTLSAKAFWVAAKYPGSTAGPVLFFVLALQLTKHHHWLTSPLRTALWSFGVLTCAVVFTNELHHWFWRSIRLVPGLPETDTDKGPLFWAYAALIYLLTLTTVVLYFRYYRATPGYFRRQASLMALAGFVPLGGRLLEDIFGLDIIPVVDNVIVLLLLSGLLFAFAIFRYGALNIIHIAHNLVIENLQAAIIVLDMAGQVVELNPYACGVLGVTDVQAIGRPASVLLADWPILEAAAGGEREVTVQHDDTETCYHVQRSLIRADDGAHAGYVFVLFDITARKNAERQLEALARTDPLTSLLNRRAFFQAAEREWARAQRQGHSVTVLMFDLDHFKGVNDRYGHQAGDLVLQRVAAICQAQLRAGDLFARYGGEEFICLLGEGPAEAGAALAERLRADVERAEIVVDGQLIPVTLSLGVAEGHAGRDSSLTQLINAADQMLYQSKAGGRNRVTVVAAAPTPSGIPDLLHPDVL